MDLGQGARDGANVILDGAARGWDQGKHHGDTPFVRVPVVVNGAVYQYGPGAVPKSYTVSGNATIYPGKRTFVTLSGSEQGVTYDLYQGAALQASLPGTGGPLNFLVTTGGNYTIKATRGDVSRDMNGSARVSYYGVLEGKIVVAASPRVMLSKDGEIKAIPFTLAPDYPQGRAELEEMSLLPRGRL